MLSDRPLLTKKFWCKTCLPYILWVHDIRSSDCLFVHLSDPPSAAGFLHLSPPNAHTPPPPPVCMLEGPYKSTLNKNRVSSKKRACVCGTFAQAHTPTPSPLEGPYKTTLHKNGGAREKRAYVWELCLGTHVPSSSKRALALAVSLSNSFGPEVALTLHF